MKAHSCIFTIIMAATFLSSCEKAIPVKLDKGTSQLTVDAFLNDEPGTQKIRLTKTGGYFDNVPNAAATGATVYVTDNQGHSYNFVDNTNSGDYIWTPSNGDTLFRLFNSYTLSVIYGGEQFKSSSIAFPAPPVDSVTYAGKKNATGKVSTNAFTASFYARDIAGMSNFYWIKAYRNNEFYSKPADMNLSQDGSVTGGGTDGLVFIFPIRTGITPRGDSIMHNDSITVKIYAINPDTFFYLSEVQTQTTNGGLFATPPSNVNTNIKNVNANSTAKAVGWFNIGAVTTGGVRVKK